MKTKNFVSNAVFGAEKNNQFIKELSNELCNTFDGTELANLSSPHLVTRMLHKKGLKKYRNKEFTIGNITLFPVRYFYPLPYGKKLKKRYIKKDSYCIHHWALRW